MATTDESSVGVSRKPFFHEHSIYVIAEGKLHAEFMNVPDLGFFVHLAKGEKQRLRIPYLVAVWICDQENKLGDRLMPEEASDDVIEDVITVTRHQIRLYFALNGYVTTTGGEPWTELVIEHNNDREGNNAAEEPNRIILTRAEYADFKRWVLRVLEDRFEEAKAREFDHGLFLFGSNHERRIRCELCLQLNGPANKFGGSSTNLGQGESSEGTKTEETNNANCVFKN